MTHAERRADLPLTFDAALVAVADRSRRARASEPSVLYAPDWRPA